MEAENVEWETVGLLAFAALVVFLPILPYKILTASDIGLKIFGTEVLIKERQDDTEVTIASAELELEPAISLVILKKGREG